MSEFNNGPSVNYDPFSSFGTAAGGEPLNIPSVNQIAQSTSLPSFVKHTLGNPANQMQQQPIQQAPNYAQMNGGYGQFLPSSNNQQPSYNNASYTNTVATMPQAMTQSVPVNVPVTLPPAPQVIPKQLGAEDIMQAVKTLSGKAIAQIQQQIQDYAEAQRLANLLRERISQGFSIKNPLSKQILVILSTFDASFPNTDRIIYALETENNLAKIISDTSLGITPLYSTKEEVTALLNSWFNQVTEECLTPYSQWASVINQ